MSSIAGSSNKSRAPLFQHSHTQTYLVLVFCACTLTYDSSLEIVERYHLNKKWFYLTGATCFFAYLYIRPAIRRRLGSASSGYINWSTVYILWLLSAVFYHLPSLSSLGINARADVSLLLTIFLLTLGVLGVVHAVHGLAVGLKLIEPRLYSPWAGPTQVFGAVVLNSLVLALACSCYYSFCGNAALSGVAGLVSSPALSSVAAALTGSKPVGGLKAAVCTKWLHPVTTHSHPAFSRWVLYGEAAASASADSASTGSRWRMGGRGSAFASSSAGGATLLEIDLPFDGLGPVSIPAAQAISPVFMLWLTLIVMWGVNCLADYAAAAALDAAYTAEMRRDLYARGRAQRRAHHYRRRRRSADAAHDLRTAASSSIKEGGLTAGGGRPGQQGMGCDSMYHRRGSSLFGSWDSLLTPGYGSSWASFAGLVDMDGEGLSSLASRGSVDLLRRAFTSAVSGSILSPDRLRRAVSGHFFRDDFSVGLGGGGQLWKAGAGNGNGNGGSAGNLEQAGQKQRLAGKAQEPLLPIPDSAPAPSFLPMFPWYSGTSADLLKTCFDLTVSVKLFLGRFDMRTMEAATARLGSSGSGGGSSDSPQDGDGFTYEHLAGREELWFDFVADTGDGGDPTYAVARCMAAPQLTVEVPQHLIESGGGSSSPYASPLDGGSPTAHTRQGRVHWQGLEAEGGEDGAGSSKTVLRTLPRASLLVHGGDLAYPNPTDETYEQRLFGPYQDAFPPPSHVHPGHLVVHKPDLPPQHWPATAECRCEGSARLGQQRPQGEGRQRPCRRCLKAATLRGYEGPTAFMVPGNHDWIDGLETFQKQVQHKGWIGGWLLPQEASYWALALPQGWWLLGVDLALVDDIDMCQYRYFARLAEERMAPGDQAIIVMHCPVWLVGWFWGEAKASNLRQLVRGPLQGRVRLHLAGDLHFYMRHSFVAHGPDKSPSLAPSELSTPAGGSPLGGSPLSSRSPTPPPGMRGSLSPSQLHQSLISRLTSNGSAGAGFVLGGSSPPGSAKVPAGTWGRTGSGKALDATAVGGASPAGASPLGSSPVSRPSSPLLQTVTPADTPFASTTGPAARAGAPLRRSASGGAGKGGSSTPESAQTRFATASSGADCASAVSGGSGDLSSLCSPPAIAIQQRQASAAQQLAANLQHSSYANGFSGASSPPMSIPGRGPAEASGAQAGSGGHGSSAACTKPLPHLSPVHTDGALEAVAAAQEAAAAAATGLPNGHAGWAAVPMANGLAHTADSGTVADAAAGSGTQGSSPTAAAAAVNGGPSFNSWWTGLRQRSVHSSGSGALGATGLPRVDTTSSFASLLDESSPTGPAGGGGPATAAAAAGAGAQEGALGSGLLGGGWQLNGPEHLVVSGCGGAFLHPTHVFSYSRFKPVSDPAAGPTYLRQQQQQLREEGGWGAPPPPSVDGAGGGGPAAADAGVGAAARRSSGSLRSVGSSSGVPPHQPYQQQQAAAHSTHTFHSFRQQQPQQPAAGGEYRCSAAHPSPQQSLRLGRLNLHTFRNVNSRFDIIGGALYYLLVVSVLPRCSGVAEILDAHTLAQGVRLFACAAWDTVLAIVTQSYVSLAALAFLFLVCLGFCKSGGVGAMPGIPPALRRRPEFHGSPLAVRARLGGLGTQLAFASAHCLAHLASAVALLLLLELGVETVMRYEGVGREGYHSLYKWYRAFEAQHFPDPVGLRDKLATVSLGLYPHGLKWLMAAFDLPESIAVSRTALCGSGLAALTRIQALGYYFGVLAYYWLLATPTVGFLFGCYLYLCINWFHVHYDEAFSSLQVQHHKGFLRFHVTPQGHLEMFSLAVDRTPSSWREDPRWRSAQGGGNREQPAYRAKYPSRWVAVEERRAGMGLGGLRMAPPPEQQLRVVDYLLVRRRRG